MFERPRTIAGLATGDFSFMTSNTKNRNNRTLFLFCIIALLLAIAAPFAAAAQGPPIGPPPINAPTTGPSTDPGGTPDPTPTRTPPPTATRPGSNPGSNPLTPTPTSSSPSTSAEEAKRKLEQALAEYELIKALAPNRIIFHAATPIQLCKVEDGLQIYYVGRDGKTRLGPWVPGFAELAAKHPDGAEASIYFGFNPLTGKRVKIDYLPHVKRIRVDTFYADRENDINKQYIFHFGPDHDIVYDAW